jgi:LmbE family N-acetylglucosaminyl deacetylase
MTGEILALLNRLPDGAAYQQSDRCGTARLYDGRSRKDPRAGTGVRPHCIKSAARLVAGCIDLAGIERSQNADPGSAFCVFEDIISVPIAMSDTFARPLVMSPHFDDAVFSCGATLAAHPGAIVYTVFSGCPASDVTTDWDRHCGFDNAAHAMRERTLEDDRALDVLAAVPVRGGFLDAQYVPFAPLARAPTQQAIAQALDHALRRHGARTLVIPLGLFHSDHELVHHACADVWRANPRLACFAYEDALYRRLAGQLQTRMADLVSRGIIATPATEHWRSNPSHQAAKRDAVNAYASQLRAFGADGYDDVFCTERCWKLELA